MNFSKIPLLRTPLWGSLILRAVQGEVLTVAEVAKLLRVSRKTVEKLIYAKKLHAVKVGRVWRIPRAAVEAFLEGKEYREP